MAARTSYQNRVELLQGTLDMLILRTLQWGPQHGHGIGQAIRANSGELLQVETGSLYPALHRLDADSDDVDQSFRSHADQIGAKRRRALSV
jgi:hypothetical protein